MSKQKFEAPLSGGDSHFLEVCHVARTKGKHIKKLSGAAFDADDLAKISIVMDRRNLEDFLLSIKTEGADALHVSRIDFIRAIMDRLTPREDV